MSLHTSPAAEPGSHDAGGMNVVVRHQAVELARLGHAVDVLTRRDSADAPDVTDLGGGARLRLVPAGPAGPIPKGDHEDLVAEFAAAVGALDGYDVIHSHHWFSGMAVLPATRAAQLPHVQSFHSIAAPESTPMSHGERPESPGRLAGERHLAGASDLVVTVSRAEAATAVERLGADPDRVAVVPPGVDASVFRPGTTDPADGHGYVLLAARLDPLKGVDLAVAALAAVPAGRRPRLVVAGAASPTNAAYVEQVRALAVELAVDGHVDLVGPRGRDELAALMRGARAVLVPSYSETYGLVALEAAASGVPVLAARSGGLAEAVHDGATGVLIGSREPGEWAHELDALLTDDARAARLGAAARAHAETMSWSASAEALLGAYRRVLPSRAGV